MRVGHLVVASALTRSLTMALVPLLLMAILMALFRPTFRFTTDRTELVGMGPLFRPVTAMA